MIVVDHCVISGKGILKITTVPGVDGAARAIMPTTTAASTSTEVRGAACSRLPLTADGADGEHALWALESLLLVSVFIQEPK